MQPFRRQLFSWQAGDPERRAAGLVLEVKGDFCYQVREIPGRGRREEDYIELSLDGAWQWNPLSAHWLDSYSLAYTIAGLLNQLFGKGKDPFWQMAYTNLLKWLIELHRVGAGEYVVTLQDIYRCAISRDLFATRIEEAEAALVLHPSAMDFDERRERIEGGPALARSRLEGFGRQAPDLDRRGRERVSLPVRHARRRARVLSEDSPRHQRRGRRRRARRTQGLEAAAPAAPGHADRVGQGGGPEFPRRVESGPGARRRRLPQERMAPDLVAAARADATTAESLLPACRLHLRRIPGLCNGGRVRPGGR